VSGTVTNVLSEEETSLSVAILIEQLLYPLASNTYYTHWQLLTTDSSGNHQWTETPDPPVETASSLRDDSLSPALGELVTITANQDLNILGYCWEASFQNVLPCPTPAHPTSQEAQAQIYTFQNIAFTANPDDGLMWTPSGYQSAPQLAFALNNATGGSIVTPLYFYLDPKADSQGGYHLRTIDPLVSSTIGVDDPQRQIAMPQCSSGGVATSMGRFPVLPTAIAVHSNGVVIGVNNQVPKIQILELPPSPVADAVAPWARLCSGPGTREGLVMYPQLAAVAPDQTLLVLEGGNSRIQAFSSGGHPVKKWPATATPYWIPLYTDSDDIDVTYMAMSIELKGYIYVLLRDGDGGTAGQFRLDVYSPEGTHLFRQCSTIGGQSTGQSSIVAGSMCVDAWRNLYSLNYQMISGPRSNGTTPPTNDTEPSVSIWIPHTPNG
jgi:hypothetical protein